MKIPTAVHRIQIWDPATGKMRQRFLFRHQMIVGGDPKSDLRLDELEGLVAKLDLAERQLDLLQDGRSVAVTPREIFTIGPYALLWTPIEFNLFKIKSYKILGALLLMGVVIFSGWIFGSEPVCSNLEVRLATQNWSTRGLTEEEQTLLEEIRRGLESARDSFRERSWVRLSSQIRDFENRLDERTQRRECRTDKGFRDLEFKMKRSMFREHLQQQEHNEALKVLEDLLQSGESKGLRGLKRELMKSARELFLEGYRKEDESPEEGAELKDRATEICQRIGYENCFEGVSEFNQKTEEVSSPRTEESN